jgi:hypothetical protein
MNTTLHQTFTYAAYVRKPTPRAVVVNRFRGFFNRLLGIFAPADEPAALRYMSSKYTDSLD